MRRKEQRNQRKLTENSKRKTEGKTKKTERGDEEWNAASEQRRGETTGGEGLYDAGPPALEIAVDLLDSPRIVRCGSVHAGAAALAATAAAVRSKEQPRLRRRDGGSSRRFRTREASARSANHDCENRKSP